MKICCSRYLTGAALDSSEFAYSMLALNLQHMQSVGRPRFETRRHVSACKTT